MTYLVYDGTFSGFLSAVFDVYLQKQEEVAIVKKSTEVPLLFATQVEVIFDEEKFKRVQAKLRAYLGQAGVNQLWKASLSELPEIEAILLGVIRYTLEKKRNVLGDFGHPWVLQLQEVLKKVGREKHRMDAFVRFKLAKDGVYYATVSPDFNVLPLISMHFKNRYADQKWLIFDTQRKYGIYYDLHSVQTVEVQDEKDEKKPCVLEIEWDEEELAFQNLWKCYFKSTTIASRKNTKLHLQYVPKRYWKYLIEKHS